VGTTNPGLIQAAANNVPVGVLSSGGVTLPSVNFQVPITDATNFATNNLNGLWTFDPNLRVPYVQQWSLGIERQISNNTAIEARYVGNHAVKLFRGVDFNEVDIFNNGFLGEFLNAQKNLAINRNSFAPGAPGTAPLPIFDALFKGFTPAQQGSSGYGSAGFINNLTNNNIGTMAYALANSPVYRTNRANLASNFFLANPNAAFARALTNNAFSNYHSLQLEVRRRLSKGLQMQANYTFSKALTNGGETQNNQSTLDTPLTLRNLALDKHRASFDQTHRFITNLIYELPFGPGRRFLNSGFAPLRKAVEGWQVGGIINVQTGPPIFITSGRTTVNQFGAGIQQFGSLIPITGAQLQGISFADFEKAAGVFKTPDGVFFFDPNLLNITKNAAGEFQNAALKPGLIGAPAPGTFGNFPRNAINGPKFTQVDLSLTKRTRVYEKADVELKVNFLNAFNNVNFLFNTQANSTSMNFDAANFGRINTTRGVEGSWGRQINFILGINF
jgi:hypothetical protein